MIDSSKKMKNTDIKMKKSVGIIGLDWLVNQANRIWFFKMCYHHPIQSNPIQNTKHTKATALQA